MIIDGNLRDVPYLIIIILLNIFCIIWGDDDTKDANILGAGIAFIVLIIILLNNLMEM